MCGTTLSVTYEKSDLTGHDIPKSLLLNLMWVRTLDK